MDAKRSDAIVEVTDAFVAEFCGGSEAVEDILYNRIYALIESLEQSQPDPPRSSVFDLGICDESKIAHAMRDNCKNWTLTHAAVGHRVFTTKLIRQEEPDACMMKSESQSSVAAQPALSNEEKLQVECLKIGLADEFCPKCGELRTAPLRDVHCDLFHVRSSVAAQGTDGLLRECDDFLYRFPAKEIDAPLLAKFLASHDAALKTSVRLEYAKEQFENWWHFPYDPEKHSDFFAQQIQKAELLAHPEKAAQPQNEGKQP